MPNLIKQFAKKYVPYWVINYAKEMLNYHRQKKSRKFIERLIKKESKIFLELGGGDKKGQGGWITLDIASGCDIYWDLRMGLPFPDNSVQKIYSSHVLEHFTYPEIIGLLKECLRVLVPSGEFSVCVPNARIYISAYLKNLELDSNQFFGHRPAFYDNSKIDYVNYTAYMDGLHKHMFDEENLLSILTKIGFSSIQSRDFDPDSDLEERKFESIYALAKK
jgi:predicted SAM-dependent methyltransferase